MPKCGPPAPGLRPVLFQGVLFAALGLACVAMLALAARDAGPDSPASERRFWVERLVAQAPRPARETRWNVARLRPVDELLECLASETAADSAVAETIALALERIWRQDMGARNESRLDEAEGLLEDGLTDEALALADLLAREAAGHAEIHGLRGRVRLEMGCYEAAVVDFREAAALNPRHWPSLRAWGRAALDRNDNTGAVEPLRALTEAFPSDRDLREELGRVLRSPEYSREEGQASWDLQSEIGSSGTERSAN